MMDFFYDVVEFLQSNPIGQKLFWSLIVIIIIVVITRMLNGFFIEALVTINDTIPLNKGLIILQALC